MTAVKKGDRFIINGEEMVVLHRLGQLGTYADRDHRRLSAERKGCRRSSSNAAPGRHLDTSRQGRPSHHLTLRRVQGHEVPVDDLLPGPAEHGDLVVDRNFAWSGPVAAIAAVDVARAAYEDALKFLKKNTAGRSLRSSASRTPATSWATSLPG